MCFLDAVLVYATPAPECARFGPPPSSRTASRQGGSWRASVLLPLMEKAAEVRMSPKLRADTKIHALQVPCHMFLQPCLQSPAPR